MVVLEEVERKFRFLVKALITCCEYFLACVSDPNSEWSVCSYTCPLDCGGPYIKRCTMDCGSPKCQCKKGYIRNKYFHCVLPRDCNNSEIDNQFGFPICTDKDEGYDGKKAHCQPTCDYPEETINCPGVVAGCRCKKGLVRGHTGKCIPKEKCDEEE